MEIGRSEAHPSAMKRISLKNPAISSNITLLPFF